VPRDRGIVGEGEFVLGKFAGFEDHATSINAIGERGLVLDHRA
jgi:hypothetical protein